MYATLRPTLCEAMPTENANAKMKETIKENKVRGLVDLVVSSAFINAKADPPLVVAIHSSTP